jgi:hypothetical protein
MATGNGNGYMHGGGEQDHYAVLDLPRHATDEEIKRRYRRLMRECHPDANADDPEATRKAARINRAFETLGNAEKRRAYDEASDRRSGRIYAYWAEQPDWEDIVAANVPPQRPPHRHDEDPMIEPDAIEVDVDELRQSNRVGRRIRLTNRCACTLRGDIATSESWVWGPLGEFTIAAGETAEFDIEIVSRKVQFPGLSRVTIVANDWTGTVPVRITGYAPKRRRVSATTAPPDLRYVRARRQKWAKYRR